LKQAKALAEALVKGYPAEGSVIFGTARQDAGVGAARQGEVMPAEAPIGRLSAAAPAKFGRYPPS
jgi:hypothetical protein